MARSLQLDTIKGILLVLVVLAHTIEVALEGTGGRAGGGWGVLYASIYLFHMPVFVFVSGYLTNPAKDVLRHAREILLLYVAAQAVWVAYEVVLGLTVSRELLPGGYEVILVGPGWGLWYLLSLFFWRAMTPVLAAVRWPVPALLALCGLAALAGRLELSGLLSLARTVSFLPFFAAGLWARQHGWSFTGRRFRWTDIPVFLAVPAVMPWLVQTSYEKTHELTYMSRPFADLGVSLADGATFRLGMLLVGLGFARLFFWVVPAVGGVFARIGANSLSVYVAHFYVVHTLRRLVPAAFWEAHLWWAAPVIVVVCCLFIGSWPAAVLEKIRSGVERLVFRHDQPADTGRMRAP